MRELRVDFRSYLLPHASWIQPTNRMLHHGLMRTVPPRAPHSRTTDDKADDERNQQYTSAPTRSNFMEDDSRSHSSQRLERGHHGRAVLSWQEHAYLSSMAQGTTSARRSTMPLGQSLTDGKKSKGRSRGVRRVEDQPTRRVLVITSW